MDGKTRYDAGEDVRSALGCANHIRDTLGAVRLALDDGPEGDARARSALQAVRDSARRQFAYVEAALAKIGEA